jgi:hypothetical protein
VAVQSYQFFSGVQLPALTAWTSANQFKMALFNTQPNLGVGSYTSLSGEVANGNGYTTGGLALPATLTNTISAASVWGTAWAHGVSYTVNNVVTSTGAVGYLFRCVSTGTSAGAAPTQTTEGALDTTSVNGTSASIGQFVNTGQSIEVWTSGVVTWTASGGSIGPAQWAVIYDNVTANKPTLMLISFGTSQTATSGNTFSVTPDALLGWWASLPQ